MKKIFFALVVLFIGKISNAQVEINYDSIIPYHDGKYMYEKVVTETDMKAAYIYKAAKIWIANTFHSGKDVIQLDDPQDAHIIGKGNFDYHVKSGISQGNHTAWFTLDIQAKDNKYRIRAYDIYDQVLNAKFYIPELLEYTKKGMAKNYYKNTIVEINDHIVDILHDLMAHITKEAVSKDDF